LDLFGKLAGMDRGTLKSKIDTTLEIVGLAQQKTSAGEDFFQRYAGQAEICAGDIT